MTSSRILKGLNEWCADYGAYLGKWTFDAPFVLGHKSGADFERLQPIIYKVIQEFVCDYDRYRELMPLSESAHRVVDIFQKFPYRPGTYRTDYVFDAQGQAKLIEITCRFALNGVFESWFYQTRAASFADRHQPGLRYQSRLGDMYAHLEARAGGRNDILILKGEDLKNSSRHYLGILRNSGYSIREMHHSDLSSNLSKLPHSLIVSELTLAEIERLPTEVLEALSECEMINDYRSVFLLHDKRFFHVLLDPSLQAACLTPAEREVLSAFLIPTYGWGQGVSFWQSAKEAREGWVLKHRALGKSVAVHAGIDTSREDWDILMRGASNGEFILQQWVPQKLWHGTVDGVDHYDYVTGTLMFFDNHYFGQGPIRTSASPVRNRTNNRSVGVIELTEDSPMWESECLGFVD